MRTYASTVDDQHVCTPDCEQYRVLSRAWCVTYARELIDANTDAATLIPGEITGMEPFVGLSDPDPGHMRIGLCHVDPQHAQYANLDDPLLVIHVLDDDGQHVSNLPIDGWHRIHRGLREGRTHLPTYLLSSATERACCLR